MDAAAFLAAVAAADANDDVISRHRARTAGLGDAAISRLVPRGVWRTLHRGVFWTRPQDGPLPLGTRLAAARLAAGGGLVPAGVVAGDGACELWGLPLIDRSSAGTDLVICGAHRRSTPGLRVSRVRLHPTEVTDRHGFPVTTALRTLRDAAGGRSFDDALVLTDAALHRGLVQRSDILGLAGLGRAATRAMLLADPRAESPFESRVRAEVIAARLPAPELQHVVSGHGRFLARVDLAWPEVGLAVEADGASVHASAGALRADLRRQNLIVAAGWQLLRFTWADLGRIAPVIRAALSSRASYRAA
jgi:very-short-patch-repair endonuclease